MNFLYTIIIFPIVQILEICYVFFYRVFSHHGFALIGVSVTVSILTLPLYFTAEKYQQKERNIQEKLKLKITKIKKAFKGDERYMVLSAYYRQNNYHPIFALRNIFSLLIQIPFFIAAFSYISSLNIFQGAGFLFINDLSKPNLPLLIIMTFVNIISSTIYTHKQDIKDKIQLYATALIFFILLLNSPSALVLYWTFNNIFSLIKNILQKTKNTKKIVFFSLLPFIIFLTFFLLFVHGGDTPKRLLACFVINVAYIIPFIKTEFIKKYFNFGNIPLVYYIMACLILFLLTGLTIPSSLISSSVNEFSFIGNRASPFLFLIYTATQATGVFLFWFIIIYFLSSKDIRNIILYVAFFLSFLALMNVFTITEKFGFLTTTMTFSEPKPFSLIPKEYLLNAFLLIIISFILLFLIIKLKFKIIFSFQTIIIVSLLILSILNIINIYKDFNLIKSKYDSERIAQDNYTAHYTFSKNGKNVLVIMIDRIIGSFVPYILQENPELQSTMNGFVLYRNTSSFSTHTLIGALPIYGGYEYTPSAVNSRETEPLLEKQKEAYLLMPKIFSDNGFTATITDPPFDNYQLSNLSIFSDFNQIKAENILGKYTSAWLRNYNDISILDIPSFLDGNLIRFSFFKCAPLFLRLFIYDKGDWLKLVNDNENRLTSSIIDDYAYLDTLPKITGFKEEGNTYTSIYSHLPHGSAFFQAPEYSPSVNVTNKGTSVLSEDSHFHTSMAAFNLIAKWFLYLKENGVYDNTRIILVSDHGAQAQGVPGNFALPNNQFMYNYNVLLMFKDFNSTHELIISDNFMTNADTPLLALEGIIENPINPFTGNPLKPDKQNGINITTLGAVSTYRHNKFTYNIRNDQWLFVKENIFEPSNWSIP